MLTIPGFMMMMFVLRIVMFILNIVISGLMIALFAMVSGIKFQ